MKIASLAGVAALFAASAVFAQQPPAPPKPPPPEHAGKHGPRMGPDMGPGMGPGREGHRPPPPPPSKAAHYRVTIGENRIDLKCAEDEPAKACADLFLQVIDKVAGK